LPQVLVQCQTTFEVLLRFSLSGLQQAHEPALARGIGQLRFEFNRPCEVGRGPFEVAFGLPLKRIGEFVRIFWRFIDLLLPCFVLLFPLIPAVLKNRIEAADQQRICSAAMGVVRWPAA